MIDLGDVSCVHVHHRHEGVHHLDALAALAWRIVHRMVIIVIVVQKSRCGYGCCLWLWFGVRIVEGNGVFDEVPGEQGDEDVQHIAKRHASQNTKVSAVR